MLIYRGMYGEKLQNILTKISEVNSEYTLEKWVFGGTFKGNMELFKFIQNPPQKVKKFHLSKLFNI
ncbi:hypothetical protein EBU71_10485 [bacterium]|nr:hypothetical protein [Candidatus Elulimicrobium humile]